MKKTLMTTLAAGAIGVAAMTMAVTPANAFVWWIIPAIVGGAVGGAAIGSAVNSQPVYGPPPGGGTVYVRPTGVSPACHIEREQLAGGGWRRVRVCD